MPYPHKGDRCNAIKVTMLRSQLILSALLLLACGGLMGEEPDQIRVPPSEPVNIAPPTKPLPGVALPPVEAEAPPPDPCLEPTPTPAPQGCVIASITCGDTIQGNNEFGNSNFDDDFYQSKFCTPQRNKYVEAPEAVYMLDVPADIKAVVTLTSECEDLDIVAISWNEAGRCPTIKHNISECEMDTHLGGGSVTMTTVTRAQKYLIAVDGKKGATGNFELAVECSEYR
ncbi:MAG: hypothetical protein ACI8RZ_003011 [Myxococcota bacterium]|jgi:hypothetical protein